MDLLTIWQFYMCHKCKKKNISIEYFLENSLNGFKFCCLSKVLIFTIILANLPTITCYYEMGYKSEHLRSDYVI